MLDRVVDDACSGAEDRSILVWGIDSDSDGEGVTTDTSTDGAVDGAWSAATPVDADADSMSTRSTAAGSHRQRYGQRPQQKGPWRRRPYRQYEQQRHSEPAYHNQVDHMSPPAAMARERKASFGNW